jgi:hypothetical protein
MKSDYGYADHDISVHLGLISVVQHSLLGEAVPPRPRFRIAVRDFEVVEI